MNTEYLINSFNSQRVKWIYLIKSIVFLVLSLLLSLGCEKSEVGECYQGRIIQRTCGGTVVQVIASQTVGETWTNNFKTPTVQYPNCLLAGNIPESYNEGDNIYFDFKEVDQFTNGNFCDIGGLPKSKAELSNVTYSNCTGN